MLLSSFSRRLCTTGATAAAAATGVYQNPCYDAVLHALFLSQFLYSFLLAGVGGM
jgi:hypothetical protein